MKYFLNEVLVNADNLKNAGSKARNDVASILEKAGYQPIDSIINNAEASSNVVEKIINQKRKYDELNNTLAELKEGDEVILQFPIIKQTILLSKILKKLISRKIKVVLLLHDLEYFRKLQMKEIPYSEKIRIKFQEILLLKIVDFIIVHNDIMKRELENLGVDEHKMVPLHIFDYLLLNNYTPKNISLKAPIIIAGNLDPKKVGYLNSLPQDVEFNLYGVGYKDNGEDNVYYHGSFLPEELVQQLAGSFGLVWDGDSSETCLGSYGNYLKYNNSHKASLYLVSGFPIIVWRDSALSNFVVQNNCGLVIDSLYDIKDRVNNISDDDYQLMRNNTLLISEKMRKGGYLLTSLKNIHTSVL